MNTRESESVVKIIETNTSNVKLEVTLMKIQRYLHEATYVPNLVYLRVLWHFISNFHISSLHF